MEKQFIENWKKTFNPHLFNDKLLQIIYIKSSKTFLNNICSLSKVENIYVLTFQETKLANQAFNEMYLIALNWKRKLQGKAIEIEVFGHSSETKKELEKLINNFFNIQKISLQSKRNKLLKDENINKKNVDKELNELLKIMTIPQF